MKVFIANAVHYRPHAIPSGVLEIIQPTWESIESAIRRLDRKEWPCILLHAELLIKGTPVENVMTILGGTGEYHINVLRDDRTIHFGSPSRGSELVQIGASDQGPLMPKHSLCNNIYRVLELVRFFAETGELSPDANWIEW